MNTRHPKRQSGRLAGSLILSLSMFFSACTSVQTTSPGAIGIDRNQRMSPLVTSEQMIEGAKASYAQVKQQASAAGTLNADAAQTRRVRAIAQRLIPEVGVYRADARAWNWEVNVIDSDDLNAWAMPGGKIAFYSGIIEKLDLGDDEIAAIMGHEIAHALREHGRERASEQATKSLVIGVLGAATGVGASTQQLADLAYQMSVGLPNSRTHETEADRMGVELAARAGYDPRAAIRVWQKMAKLSGGSSGPEFLSTHPSHASRISDLQAYARKVMPLYEQARRS